MSIAGDLAPVAQIDELGLIGKSAQRVASVDGQQLPRHPGRLWAGHVSNGVRNVVDLAVPADRLPREELREQRLVRERTSGAGGSGQTRLNRVHADPGDAEFVSRDSDQL